MSRICLLFTVDMRHNIFYIIIVILIVALSSLIQSCSFKDDDTLSKERVKIVLREVGNQLLLAQQDSTSLILPIKAIGKSKYEIPFQSTLSIEPDALVKLVDTVFNSSKFPDDYRVEVLQCIDNEVAYSYVITDREETTLIPCNGRLLPKACYVIQIQFITKEAAVNAITKKSLFYVYVVIVVFLLALYFYKKKQAFRPQDIDASYYLGSFQFYPDQNKLVKSATEISLSKKECELLEIFVSNPNQVVKRDELTKRVWEDNGVIVGRSLDTYISKLRKKLQEDPSIKLTNIHGVGYKLEV